MALKTRAHAIWYQVVTLNRPAAEPFVVVRVDVSVRREGGVEGTVESLHWARDEAEARAQELTEAMTDPQTTLGTSPPEQDK